MKREEYILDEMVVKCVNAAVRIIDSEKKTGGGINDFAAGSICYD